MVWKRRPTPTLSSHPELEPDKGSAVVISYCRYVRLSFCRFFWLSVAPHASEA